MPMCGCRFYNADGSRPAACGNATRCIARHLMEAAGTDRLTLRTDHTAIAGPRRWAAA
jgi:diaminopimelate epimerase